MENIVFYHIGVESPITPDEQMPPLPPIPQKRVDRCRSTDQSTDSIYALLLHNPIQI